MKFTITHSYAKDTDTVFKVLTDESYLVKKIEATGAKKIQIPECKESGNNFVIRRQMDIPANPPGFAKKFVKSMNTVIAKDIWESYDKDEKTLVLLLDEGDRALEGALDEAIGEWKDKSESVDLCAVYEQKRGDKVKVHDIEIKQKEVAT